MAKSVRLEMNSAGFRQILRSEKVRDHLASRAQNIADAAGPGMEASSAVGSNRARASVVTATREAMLAEAEDKALTSAIDAGRG